MNFLKKLIIDKLLKTYLKGFLDKLPLNEYKTLISIAFYILVDISTKVTLGEGSSEMLVTVIELVRPYATEMQLSAVVGALLGLIHKPLKKDAKA